MKNCVLWKVSRFFHIFSPKSIVLKSVISFSVSVLKVLRKQFSELFSWSVGGLPFRSRKRTSNETKLWLDLGFNAGVKTSDGRSFWTFLRFLCWESQICSRHALLVEVPYSLYQGCRIQIIAGPVMCLFLFGVIPISPSCNLTENSPLFLLKLLHFVAVGPPIDHPYIFNAMG